MCGMRVVWANSAGADSPHIRLMGGDYDPGHSGRNRDEDSRANANEEKRSEDKEAERIEQRPWNEMRCLISAGQVRRSVWPAGGPTKEASQKALTFSFCFFISFFSHLGQQPITGNFHCVPKQDPGSRPLGLLNAFGLPVCVGSSSTVSTCVCWLVFLSVYQRSVIVFSGFL